MFILQRRFSLERRKPDEPDRHPRRIFGALCSPNYERPKDVVAALERDVKPRKLAPAIDRQILAIAIEQAFTDASDAQLSRPGEFLIDRLALLGLEISRARPLT